MRKMRPIKNRVAQQSLPKIGSAQIRFGQISAFQICAPQLGVHQERVVSARETQIHLIQMRAGNFLHVFIGPRRAARQRRGKRSLRQVRIRPVAHGLKNHGGPAARVGGRFARGGPVVGRQAAVHSQRNDKEDKAGGERRARGA